MFEPGSRVIYTRSSGNLLLVTVVGPSPRGEGFTLSGEEEPRQEPTISNNAQPPSSDPTPAQPADPPAPLAALPTLSGEEEPRQEPTASDKASQFRLKPSVTGRPRCTAHPVRRRRPPPPPPPQKEGPEDHGAVPQSPEGYHTGYQGFCTGY